MAKGMNDLKDMANRLTPVQKILLGAAVLTVAVGAVVLRGNTPAPTMVPLFTDLAASDAQSVLDELDTRGVQHDLTDSGKTILVPEADVYDLRIALSAAGLPANNDGYALLDQQGITTSEFIQRVDYQRALEGELANTLRAMDGVKNATVHLALPDDSLFVDQPATTTASVMIDTGGMDSLSADSVQAIVHLVASSVKGLDPTNVTVIDAKGAVLSGAGSDVSGTAGGATARAKAEAAYEQSIVAQLTPMLSNVAGAGKFSVTVKANLDLDQVSLTSEQWGQSDPNSTTKNPGVVANESTKDENYEGSGAALSTGVLGPDGANVAATGNGTGNDTYTNKQADRNYDVDRVVQQIVRTPGAVTALHVAVLFDDQSVSEKQATAMEKTIESALGYDQARGDSLVVTRMPFAETVTQDTTAQAQAEAAAQSQDQMYSLIRTGAIAFVVLLAILLGWTSARKARREVLTPLELPALEAGHRDTIHAGEATMTPRTLQLPHHVPEIQHADEPAAIHFPDVPSLPALALESNREIEEIQQLASESPADVANVIKSWLSADLEASRS